MSLAICASGALSTVEIVCICIGGAVGAALLAALFVLYSNNCIGVTRYSIKSDKAPVDGVKIVHLSDLHGKSFGKDNRRLTDIIKRLSPDIIAVTGDIIHKYRDKDIAVALRTVEALKDVAPVYYVSGNHEMRSRRYRELKEELIKSGAFVLDDGVAEVCGVVLCGVNCAHIKRGGYFNLPREGSYNILLAHLPQYISRYAVAGFDLALCGHAHGGQWRIPFTSVGIYSPGQGLFPKYSEGKHLCGDMLEIISRGLGNSECPLRLFNRPEVVVAEIKR